MPIEQAIPLPALGSHLPRMYLVQCKRVVGFIYERQNPTLAYAQRRAKVMPLVVAAFHFARFSNTGRSASGSVAIQVG
jgi:hypothetical protein